MSLSNKNQNPKKDGEKLSIIKYLIMGRRKLCSLQYDSHCCFWFQVVRQAFYDDNYKDTYNRSYFSKFCYGVKQAQAIPTILLIKIQYHNAVLFYAGFGHTVLRPGISAGKVVASLQWVKIVIIMRELIKQGSYSYVSIYTPSFNYPNAPSGIHSKKSFLTDGAYSSSSKLFLGSN